MTNELSVWTFPSPMLQNLLFPGNNEALKVNFLKPNGVSPAFLARMRLGCFVWMLFQLLANNFISSNSTLLFTFTNWSVTANFLSYLILVWAHLLNGDFFKTIYEEIDPSQVDSFRRPYYLWSAAQGFYEFSFTMSISVTFAYGGILYSYMRNNGWFTGAPWYYDLAGWLMHLLPQIFQLVEWQYNSIPL